MYTFNAPMFIINAPMFKTSAPRFKTYSHDQKVLKKYLNNDDRLPIFVTQNYLYS